MTYAQKTMTEVGDAFGSPSGVLGSDGNIYCAPNVRNQARKTEVIKVDVQTNTISPIGKTYVDRGWFGGIAADDGNIYFLPNTTGKK